MIFIIYFVGDGFIRPEITSLCFNGRYLPQIDERAYLGTDKSVPYKKAIEHGFNGFTPFKTHISPTISPTPFT
ncbi:MAG: hypothetical protein FWG87_05105 [Defluviitaleaceae bacterium]|nr:hypothetical protein [Defluviitaleaceae bacterium]